MSSGPYDSGLVSTGRWRGTSAAPAALCLPPGQRVLTADGYRPVAEVDVRDSVETGAGRLRLVTKVFRRDVDEALVRVRTAGVHVLRATGQHHLLCRRDEGPAQWVTADTLRVGDLVAVRGNGIAGNARVRAPQCSPWPHISPSGTRTRDGSVATLVRKERAPYWLTDWTRVAAVDTAPYAGPVYDLEVEEDHSYVTDGIVVADCSGFWTSACHKA